MPHPLSTTSLLFLTLLFICIKDLREGIIPDLLLVIMTILGLSQHGITNAITVAILGGVAYSLYKLYPLIKKTEWLGFGDVKMMAASGLWLDMSQIPLYLMVGGGIGILTGLLWKGRRFPFAPALALSLGICIVGSNALYGKDNKIMTFKAHTLVPTSGHQPDSIVVLLHGYGSNGRDLLSLAHAWAPQFPNTLFVSPDGPEQSDVNPFGNQWFGLDDWHPTEQLTKENVARMMRDVQALTPSVNHYLDDLLKTHGLPPEKLALVGFSQGAMLALHVGLHRPQCAGVVAYSGAFLEDLNEAILARPPVLLIHGAEDQVVSALFAQIAKGRLESHNVPVTLSVLPHLDHSIDGRGLGMGAAFLKENLYKAGL